jgi:carboxyl-terminal processing protease
MVVDTIPEGPSDKAGVVPMDKIIEIDGKPLEGMSTDEALAYLKGPKGTTVHIKILRDEQQDLLEFDIVRDIIKEQVSLAFYLEQQQIYYVALTMFTSNSASQLEHILNKAQDKSVRALIIDLRNNSGGLLDAAVDIVGLFVPKGSLVVTTKDKNNNETSRYVTKRNPLDLHLPIFILVNNFTASAAEILAGCLKQHAMHPKENKKKQLNVFITGTKTFGKGSVQEVIPVSNNSAVKVTTSLYFLPDDVSIQGVGITPDFIIEKTFPPTKQVSWFTKFYGREQSLKNYIRIDNHTNEAAKEQEKTNETKKQSWNMRAQKRLQEDNQFKETVSIINLYHMAFTSCPQNITNRTKAIQFINSIYMAHSDIAMVEVKI